MSDINKWFNSNFLKINYNKTCYFLFSISKTKNYQINDYIKIHDFKYLEINSLNYNNINCSCIHIVFRLYLTVTTNLYLKWKIHIQTTAKKVRSMFCINSIPTLNNILLPNTMRIIYCAFAHSVFFHGLAAWRGAYDTHKKT